MGLMDRLKEAAANLGRDHTDFDPESLGDPHALRTQWSPLRPGGTRGISFRLEQVTLRRIEFRIPKPVLVIPVGSMVFGGIGLLAGLVGAVMGEPQSLIASLIGLVIAIIGFVLFRHWTTPRVFDRYVGYFWRGRGEPTAADLGEVDQAIPLDAIYAVQIIQELANKPRTRRDGTRIDSENNSYFSYELNLVLDDGLRMNVVDNSNRQWIQADAAILGEFLKVPVWDASWC